MKYSDINLLCANYNYNFIIQFRMNGICFPNYLCANEQKI